MSALKSISQISAAMLLFASVTVSIGGCGCGFDCNSGSGNNSNDTTLLSLGFSDAAPEDLNQVVIEVDSITFLRRDEEDVVVDSFTIAELDLVDADTFQVDLLQYRGRDQLLAIDDLKLQRGTYSGILISILDDDINFSYIQEADDSLVELNAPAAGLSLPGMTLSSDEQQFTVEFGLAQSLQFQASSDTYLLATDGIRVEDNATAASVTGRVDSALFDTVSPCDEKEDPEQGNRIYIYEGISLSVSELADVYTSSSGTEIPDDVRAPFAVAALLEDTSTGGWQYVFGFLPAGDYTIAFACDTAKDDPVNYDGLVIPLPEDQIYEVALLEGERKVCDIVEGGGAC